MRVLGIGVNFELLRHRFAEFRLRQHAPDGELKHSLGLLRYHLFRGDLSQTSGIPRVMAVEFLLNLISLQHYFACIDHYDVIAGVEKGSPLRTTFACQD